MIWPSKGDLNGLPLSGEGWQGQRPERTQAILVSHVSNVNSFVVFSNSNLQKKKKNEYSFIGCRVNASHFPIEESELPLPRAGLPKVVSRQLPAWIPRWNPFKAHRNPRMVRNNLSSNPVLHLPTEVWTRRAVKHDCLRSAIEGTDDNVVSPREYSLCPRGDILVKGITVRCHSTASVKVVRCGTSGCGHVESLSVLGKEERNSMRHR